MGPLRLVTPGFIRPLLHISALSCTAAVLAGCGMGTVTHSTGGAMALHGVVHGGQNPVYQAAIQLYTVGKLGNGSKAQAMISTAVSTAQDGSFDITDDYSCGSSNDQVYIVATGGNPGLVAGTDNDALVLMAALGSCGNLATTPFIEINEVTTAAAAWALTPFIASADHIGASPTNSKGIASAFLNSQLLADSTTGLAPAALPSNLSTETGKLYALANALAACVNSTGSGSSGCQALFTAATPMQGAKPGNTLSAALSIVQNPGQNVLLVYQAQSAEPPFPSTLSTQPNDWTMSLTITGGGLDSPTALGVDGYNNVWVANYNGPLSAFTAQGTPFNSTGYGAGDLSEVYGLTIDLNNNIWLTNEEKPVHGETKGSITAFQGAGSTTPGSVLNGMAPYYDSTMDFPYALATAPDGDILISDYANSTASIYNDTGGFVEGGVASGSASLPVAIAADPLNGVWLANSGNDFVTHVAVDGTVLAYFKCCDGANGVATDNLGNAWLSSYYGGTLSEVSPLAGTTAVELTASGGGMTDNAPSAIAVDAAQNVWVANFYGANFTEIAGSASTGTLSVGDPISPSYGYGLDANLLLPYTIAPDAAGNLWISNHGVNTVTMFFGLAAPTVTPLKPTPTAP